MFGFTARHLMTTVTKESSADVCANYWTRGSAVCANGRMAAMDVADAALRAKLADEVLQPRVIGPALDQAVKLLQTDPDARDRVARRGRLEKRIGGLELANLAEMAARGGAVPAIMDSLNRKDQERRAAVAELAGVQSSPAAIVFEPRALRGSSPGCSRTGSVGSPATSSRRASSSASCCAIVWNSSSRHRPTATGSK